MFTLSWVTMNPIDVVVWDIDRVWYPDISTTYVARCSKADHRPYLDDFVSRGWFNYAHVAQWERLTGRAVSSVGTVADMLTDFLYKPELRTTVYEGVPDQDAKNRTIVGKQALLNGMTFGEVFEIANRVQNTEGLLDAIGIMDHVHVNHVGFSDGLGPFVAYKMHHLSVEAGGIVPALVRMEDDQEVYFDRSNLNLLNNPEIVLLGRTGDFKKGDAIFRYLDQHGWSLDRAAAIDDSAANIGTLTRIRDGGGIAVGFNVNDIKKFQEAKIPVIKGSSVYPLAEIVTDRAKVNEFCETWGIKV